MKLYYKSVPFAKEDVTLALESGVDGIIVPREDVPSVALTEKADEEAVVQRLRRGETVSLARGWEIIPVENLLAQCDHVLADAGTLEEARLAGGILERGVDGVVLVPEARGELKAIVAACKVAQGREALRSEEHTSELQ